MLADDAAGVRVVGRDAHLTTVVVWLTVGRPCPQAGRPQQAQAAAHAVGQLAGGLAGEGQAEHLIGPHLTAGHQPDHPSGHRLGLS